jgi:hypothetical protein
MSRRGWNGDAGRAGISLSRPPTHRVRRRNVLSQVQNAGILRFVALCGRRADVPTCPTSGRTRRGAGNASADPRIRRSTEHAGGKSNPQWAPCPDFRQYSPGSPAVTAPPRRTLYRRTRDRGSGRGPATDGERPARLSAPEAPSMARIARTHTAGAHPTGAPCAGPPGAGPHRAGPRRTHSRPAGPCPTGRRHAGLHRAARPRPRRRPLARIAPCTPEHRPACRVTLRGHPCAPRNVPFAPCNRALPGASGAPSGARAGARRHARCTSPAPRPVPGSDGPLRWRPAGGRGRGRALGRVRLGPGARGAPDVRIQAAASRRRGGRTRGRDGALRGAAAPLRQPHAHRADVAGACPGTTAGTGIPVEPPRLAVRADAQRGASGRTPLPPAHNPALMPPASGTCTIFRPSCGSPATIGRTHSEQGRYPCPERPGVSGPPVRGGGPAEAHFPPSSTNATVRDRMLHATWPCRHCGEW